MIMLLYLSKVMDICCMIIIIFKKNLQRMDEEKKFPEEVFIFIIILVIYVLTSHLIQVKKVPYLHESTMAIFMGVLTAIFAKYGLHAEIQFDNEVFFAIILPPIIFSAGYSLRKSLFFENFAMIGYLGIVGTIIGFICMTAFLILINTYIFQALTLTELMMISSVLCATDTVAAMALIKPDKYPVLNAVLFGQGIINDAVAIILFRTVYELDIKTTGEFTFKTVLQMAFQFTYLFFFSVALGALSGFGLSYLFKVIDSFNRYPLKETSLILLNGYLTYLFGELLGLSGIITLFTCAIIMGHYCFMNISEESQKGTGLAFQTVSYIAEAFVFAYLGASVLSIDGKWSAVGMGFMILAAMPFIRAIMVYSLPLIYKIIKRRFPMNSKELKVCWYSGMVRGVIAFALCLQINSNDKKFIVTVALVIVMATTILGSTLLKSFINCIGMVESNEVDEQDELYEKMKEEKQSDREKVKNKTLPPEQKQEEDVNSSRFQQFEEKYIKPIFERQKEETVNYEMEEQNKKQGSDSAVLEEEEIKEKEIKVD